jgi:glycosyltransferase involved in cell wall biosynthesis
MNTTVHLLSFEGPDPYALAGGVGTRIWGLARALAQLRIETHLWFIGDPQLPGYDRRGHLHLHRWCQWMNRHHPVGVYDGERAKAEGYTNSLPSAVGDDILAAINAGQQVIVLAEEWHTVGAVLRLDQLLREYQVRDRVSLLWNANNTFGFSEIDWHRLSRAAVITTVSRYMKQLMRPLGAEAVVIPNGLGAEAFAPVNETMAEALGKVVGDRLLLTKVARWDPDKRWLGTLDIVASLKHTGQRPILVARGGIEAHGETVLARARSLGLTVADVTLPPTEGARALVNTLGDARRLDLLNVRSALDWETRRLLYRGSAAVLANSGHEPFGLVGLETMAAGGIACTGSSAEDYAVPGHNALVLETQNPDEFLGLFAQMRNEPARERAVREAAALTARRYAWPLVIDRLLLPRAQLALLSRRATRTSPIPNVPENAALVF